MDSIGPFFSLGGHPNQQDAFNRQSSGRGLRDYENARAQVALIEERAKVVAANCQHFRIGYAIETG